MGYPESFGKERNTIMSHPNTWHVYPQNDLKPHQTEGYECECNPKVTYDDQDEFVMVVHNAFDNRERMEAFNLGRINDN
jgi:hypothetical protein